MVPPHNSVGGLLQQDLAPVLFDAPQPCLPNCPQPCGVPSRRGNKTCCLDFGHFRLRDSKRIGTSYSKIFSSSLTMAEFFCGTKRNDAVVSIARDSPQSLCWPRSYTRPSWSLLHLAERSCRFGASQQYQLHFLTRLGMATRFKYLAAQTSLPFSLITTTELLAQHLQPKHK
jgi:hypothetical protein